jgi:hypothetical protein
MEMLDIVSKPSKFLKHFKVDVEGELKDYEDWWFEEGLKISENIDRLGTPHLRMFDRFGKRIDEILYPREYWDMLYGGYKLGVVADPIESGNLLKFFKIGYITSFFIPFPFPPLYPYTSTHPKG